VEVQFGKYKVWEVGQEVEKGVGGRVERVPRIEVNLCFHLGAQISSDVVVIGCWNDR